MEALGISIDGNEIKFALLRKKDKQIELVNYEKIHLQEGGRKKEEGEAHEESYDEVFGLAEPEEKQETPQEEIGEPSETDTNLLFNAVSKYGDTKPKIGTNILQSDVSFTNVTITGDLKGKNLKKTVKDELLNMTQDIDDENFGYISKNGTECIAFYHNKKLFLLNQVFDIVKELKSNMKISLVDLNELALINLFNTMVEVEDEFSIVIYVGNEFSRILYFQGKNLVSLSPLINEGYRSETLSSALYGKIIFEHDTLGFEEVNNLYITGDGDIKKYVEFFKGKFADSNVSGFPFNQFLSVPEEVESRAIDSFAIPITIAWKILEGKERNFIDTNFLPSAVAKQQKLFTITWHGLILALLILLSAGYFLYSNNGVNKKIKEVKREINNLNIKIEGITPVVGAVDSISNDIKNFSSVSVLMDSLKPKNILFSDFITYFTNNIDEINSIWLLDFSRTLNNFNISGDALYRTRIFRLANTFKDSQIRSVNSKIIMRKNIFNFHISGKIPQRKE